MFEHLTTWLEQLPFAVAISQGDWLFPGLESLHVLAIALVFGSIAMVDLRLLNVALRSRSLHQLSREIVPWTWTAFVGAVVSGGLLFSSAATKYFGYWQFKLKMVLILCAGINMLIFNVFVARNIAQWSEGKTPVSARVSGGVSLLLWTAVIVCGRWIGFL